MKVETFAKRFGITQTPEIKIIGRTHYAIPKTHEPFVSKRPAYIGTCIAHQRGDKLIPSVDYLQEIAKHALNRATLTPEGEWLLICGRDLFGKSIVKSSGPRNKGEWIVLLNQHGECVGYGEIVAQLNQKGKVINRRFDIGDLIRREKRK